MTDKQPEAMRLRLADELDTDRNWLAARGLHQQSMAEAAAELRRLHAENEALRSAANRGGHMTVAWELQKADEALLWLCREMIRELPVAHPQQGPRRDELIEALNKRLTNG